MKKQVVKKRSTKKRTMRNQAVNGKKGNKKNTVNREYKSTMFAMIYRDRRELLQLYNAMNNTNYSDPDLLEINTLENAIYLSVKNDVSFIIDARLVLYEHQSTFNPNLPLRDLLYAADIYSAYVRNMNIYGTKPLVIPTPHFVIFYNGTKELPDKMEMKLSDLYAVKEKEPALELKVTMYNINKGKNQKLMNACKTLRDYAEYTARVRDYAEEMELEVAVERAITECIREGILVDFLSKNRWEAKKMSIYEYDEEKYRKFLREDAREEGEERFVTLLKQMSLNGDEDKIILILSDRELRKKMYQKYEKYIQVA